MFLDVSRMNPAACSIASARYPSSLTIRFASDWNRSGSPFGGTCDRMIKSSVASCGLRISISIPSAGISYTFGFLVVIIVCLPGSRCGRKPYTAAKSSKLSITNNQRSWQFNHDKTVFATSFGWESTVPFSRPAVFAISWNPERSEAWLTPVIQ